MKKRGVLKAIVVTVLCIAGVSPAYAQKLTLTLDEAIAAGLKNSESVKAKQVAVQSAEQGVRSAESSRFPTVSVGARYTHLFEPITAGTTAAIYTSSQDPVSLSASLSQVITTFGKINSAVRLSEAGVSTARLALEEEKRSLSVSIQRGFYGYLLAREMLTVQEKTLSYKEDALRIARERYEAGLIPDYEVLRAESDLESYRPTLLAARNQVENSLIAVVDLLGIEGVWEEVTLVGSLEEEHTPLTPEGLEQQALSNNYSLRQYGQSILLQEVQNDLNKRQKNPTVSAFAEYSLKSGVDSATGAPLYWGEDSWEGDLSVGLQVTVPLSNLFPWSGENAAIAQGELDRKRLGYERDSLKTSVQSAIETLLRTIEQKESQIASNRKAVSLAERLYESAKERYRNGLITSLELQDAQVNLNGARLGYLEAVYDYKTALFDLMDAVGVDRL
ncbi:MAG: TolC family protein [Spirochaetes bacterium]|nr:TolC family protein [Spirochaetota bacterium]